MPNISDEALESIHSFECEAIKEANRVVGRSYRTDIRDLCEDLKAAREDVKHYTRLARQLSHSLLRIITCPPFPIEDCGPTPEHLERHEHIVDVVRSRVTTLNKEIEYLRRQLRELGQQRAESIRDPA